MVKILDFKKVSIIALTLICASIFCACIYFSGAFQVLVGGKMRALPIYSVERTDNKISISFDCAWGTDYTDELLAQLEKEGVKATFFMVEFWAEKYPDYVQKICSAGHEIGTHSKTHSYMSKQGVDEIKNELLSSSAVIEKITGKKVDLFRAPYGDYDDQLINTAQSLGFYTIQWDVDSLDWKNLSAKKILSRVAKMVKSGSIILMHNNGLHTAKAVPQIIKSLKERGFEFVPIGELIYRENYTIDANGRQHGAN